MKLASSIYQHVNFKLKFNSEKKIKLAKTISFHSIHNVVDCAWCPTGDVGGTCGQSWTLQASEAGKGVCRVSDTPTIYVGDIDMYIPEKSDNNIYVEFQST